MMRIRTRLALWHFFTTLLLLIFFSMGVYLAMGRLLYRSMDKDLRIVADAIERSYLPHTKKFEWLENIRQKRMPFLDYYVVVYDVAGREIYRSPLAQVVALPVQLTRHHRQQENTLEISVKTANRWLHPDAGGEVTFRAINRKLYYKRHQVGWVTVALPFEPIENSMDKLVTAIFLGIVATVLFIGAGAYWLTRKTLSPVEVITRKAAQISHSNLNQRIKGIDTGDELGHLTATLNNLLERLQAAFESQKYFLADAAHELKTPLALLRSHWEEELNNPHLPTSLKEKLAHDVETISRLTHLLNNLLLLSQTEKIDENFDFEEVKLDELLRDVAADVRILAQLKQQNLEVASIQPVTIMGDSRRLYQLFFNILENAVKYSPSGAEIALVAQVAGQRVEVEICDSGPGIPPEDLPHIFERFYRVQKDRARNTGGSGLGLAIARLIAEAHGGRIEAESRIGEGSVFRVWLPLRDETHDAPTIS